VSPASAPADEQLCWLEELAHVPTAHLLGLPAEVERVGQVETGAVVLESAVSTSCCSLRSAPARMMVAQMRSVP
jgi:hypothetical protein